MGTSEVQTMTLTEFIEENMRSAVAELPWMKGKNIRLCKSIEDLRSYIDQGINNGRCALDLETTGLNTRLDLNGNPIEKIVGIALAINEDDGIYVAINHQEGNEDNLREQEVLEEIRRLCSCCVILVFNAKFDLQFLKNYGIIVSDPSMFEDVLILARLYDAGQKINNLKTLGDTLLKRPQIDFKKATGGTTRFDFTPPSSGYLYAAPDAMNTFGLYNFFINHPIIISQKNIYAIEKKLCPVIMQMEQNLVLIDKPYLEEQKIKATKILGNIEKEVQALAKKDFNLSSTQQLGKILFEDLKFDYPEKDKTKSGQYKTDDATLKKIADKYPIVKKIVEYRELDKSLGTYVTNLLINCDENNCIKLGFNQNGTDTGRFSSPGGMGLKLDGYCGVNVQSIPANDSDKVSDNLPDIRRSFIARPGKKILAMDFSGEELRVAANLSNEPVWIKEFLHGSADMHTATACAVYNKEAKDISKSERKIAKTVNFLILYGGGVTKLSENAHIPFNEAKRIIGTFFEKLSKLKNWIDTETKLARKLKYAETSFGRRRPLHEMYDSGDERQMAHADRCAVNFKIQGACADICKIAMVRVQNWIYNNNLQNSIKLLVTVHDELVFEIDNDKLDQCIPVINKIMCLQDILQDKFHWPVPLVIDAEYGDSWHVEHNFFKEHPELRNLNLDINYEAPTAINRLMSVDTKVSPTNIKENIEPLIVQDPVVEKVIENIEIVESEIEEPVKESESESQIEMGDDGELIYTVREMSLPVSRKINDIIEFLKSECNNEFYSGAIKKIRVRDLSGYDLIISDIRVRADSFLALARFYGL